MLRSQRSSHIPTLWPKYLPCSYLDPLGVDCDDKQFTSSLLVPRQLSDIVYEALKRQDAQRVPTSVQQLGSGSRAHGLGEFVTVEEECSYLA